MKCILGLYLQESVFVFQVQGDSWAITSLMGGRWEGTLHKPVQGLAGGRAGRLNEPGREGGDRGVGPLVVVQRTNLRNRSHTFAINGRLRELMGGKAIWIDLRSTTIVTIYYYYYYKLPGFYNRVGGNHRSSQPASILHTFNHPPSGTTYIGVFYTAVHVRYCQCSWLASTVLRHHRDVRGRSSLFEEDFHTCAENMPVCQKCLICLARPKSTGFDMDTHA